MTRGKHAWRKHLAAAWLLGTSRVSKWVWQSAPAAQFGPDKKLSPDGFGNKQGRLPQELWPIPGACTKSSRPPPPRQKADRATFGSQSSAGHGLRRVQQQNAAAGQGSHGCKARKPCPLCPLRFTLPSTAFHPATLPQPTGTLSQFFRISG